ncbi:MAG: ribonucleoside triphosphate reductase [Candidatus Uhrbacteria bacterium]|nr:ribonucleoside triphosphate reductase [Candidatus Uhrbacteria bacterium]
MTIIHVIKRDGTKVEFDKERIVSAISQAAKSTGEFEESEARKIAETASHYILKAKRFEDDISVEDIQDIVEFALLSSGHFKTARAYIVYREKRAQVRDTEKCVVDVGNTIQEYLNQSDWRVNENANRGYSLGGLIMNASEKIIANYWLNYIFPKEVRDAHVEGDFHIHDLGFFSGYCAGWSIRQLLEEGFNGIPGKVESAPPKHLETAVAQMVNFLGTLQNEWAGAQAFSSFDTYLAPYVKIDELDHKRVKQSVQQFVFNLNVPSRWGTQTPFTNITLDWVCPADMKDKHPIIGGVEQEFTYGDCQKEMDMINKVFIEVMSEGDWHGRIFTFPIPTYNITKDFDWDNENAQALFEMTAKYGIPYFQNFINSTLDPSDVRSMCCRLQLDLRELRSRGGGLFGSAEMTGSSGIVSINLSRLGYLSKTKEDFYTRLGRLMDVAKESLEIRRKVVQQNIDRGLLPFTKRFLGNLHNHFSTIGLNGMNEACLNFFGKDIATEEGRVFALEALDFMRDRLATYQEETGHMYNLEATPAEGVTYRFAKEDRMRYPGIIQAGTEEAPYYTNSTHLPVGYTDDPIAALSHQDELQTKYTGGTVLHLFLGEQVSDWKTCREFVRKVAYQFHLPYFTITPTFSVCKNHGYLSGEVSVCAVCQEPTEVWSRIVGYFRPVDQWNRGKKSEWTDRVEYAVPGPEVGSNKKTVETSSEKESSAQAEAVL